jgi:hypothetical protein
MRTRWEVGSLLLICNTSLAGVATFDTLPEGIYGQVLVDGGITFFNGDSRIGPPGGPASALVVDDVSGLFPLVTEYAPHFSSPNILTLTSFGVGPDAGGGRVGAISMTTGTSESFASVDVFFGGDPRRKGNTVSLSAYRDGLLVALTTEPVLPANYQHAELSIVGVEFDTLRLEGQGPVENGVLFGGIDNVIITPDASGLSLCAICVSVLVVSRRRPVCRRAGRTT